MTSNRDRPAEGGETTPSPSARLVGREAEVSRLRCLIEAARAGRGGALRISGEPGIGKSALLAAVAPADLLCLRATGFEHEIELPFAGVEQLRADLPEEARGAIGPGAGPLDPAAALGELADRLAALAPLVVLADDVQWLDPSSRMAIAYLARRAPRLGIAVIAVWSRRDSPPEEWPDVPELELRGLDRAAALALAARGGLSAAVAEALVDAVGGNPLALVAAPGTLSAAQRAGRELLPEPLPVGARLERAYAARLGALPEATRTMLLLAAAGAPPELVSAELGPAEDAGLVRLRRAPGSAAGGVEFVHPLVRAAIYHAAAPSARRHAHREIAAAASEPERSWQLSLAATGPDEELAAQLERLAEEANHRGAPASAASAMERAAALTPDPARGAGRQMRAAGLAMGAGRPARAQALLDPLLPAVTDPAIRADLQLLRGISLYLTGKPRAACELFEAEAAVVADTDPGRATALLTQACVALLGPGPIERVAELAERAAAMAPAGAETIPRLVRAETLVALGEHAGARSELDRLEPELASWDPTAPGHELLAVAGLCRLWMGDHELAGTLLRRLIEADRAAGALSVLAAPLAVLASLQIRRGELDEAAVSAGEAEEIAETGLSGFGLTLALSAVALVAAHRGDAETCERAAARMLALGSDLEQTSTLAAAEQALGHLRLGQGDSLAAAEHLERALAHTRAHGTRDPAFLFTHADLVEALVRCGREAEAGEVLAELEAAGERSGGAWARAAVARCRGLLGVGDLDANLAAALAAHEDPPMPFEAARTRLALGERMRRLRRRSDARAQLSAARDAFAKADAPGWAARASAELAAVDGHPRAPRAGETAELTAREREVCALTAAGATNREVAARLFVSPRTVEHHLRQAYRKLGIRSRTELAARWKD